MITGQSIFSKALIGSLVPAFWLMLLGSSFANDPDIELQELVDQLGSEDYMTREQAFDAVWRYGREAIPLLREATESGLPEVVYRAKTILRNIEAGIMADLPPLVAEAVEVFHSGGLEVKRSSFNTLRGLKAFKQIVYLYSWLPEGKIRDELAAEIKDVPIYAAQDSVYAGKMEEAFTILKISPETGDVIRAKARLARQLGIVEQELEEAEAKEEQEYHLALLVEQNNRANIQEFAAKLNLNWTLAMLQLEEGNALPIMEQMDNIKVDQDELLRQACEVFKLRNKGDFLSSKKLADDLTSRSENEDDLALFKLAVGLLINGYGKEAELILEREKPLIAFEYYDHKERPSDALRVIGCPTKPEELDAWRDSLIEQAVGVVTKERYHASAVLLGMTRFYYERYGIEKALVFVMPYFSSLRDIEEYSVHDVLGYLYTKLPELSVEIALKIFENKDDFNYIVAECFGERRELAYIQEILRAYYPNYTERQLFSLLASMAGAKYEDAEVMREHQVLLLEDAKASGDEEHLKKTGEALFYLAFVRSDLESIPELSELLVELGVRISEGDRKRLFELNLSLADYAQKVKLFEENKSSASFSVKWLTKWSVALHHLGQKEKSEEKLEQALDLAMNQGAFTLQIVGELNEGQLHGRALGVLQNQLLMYHPESIMGENIAAGNMFMSWFFQGAVRCFKAPKTGSEWEQRSAYRQAFVYAELLDNKLRIERVNYIDSFAFHSLFDQGMACHADNQVSQAVELLGRAHAFSKRDGLLADEFFPLIKKAGYEEEHDRWFADSYRLLADVVERYPNAHNTLNTAAWLAARSVRELERSLGFIDRALKLRPNQGAYLDTKAELLFSSRKRNDAIFWSKKAVGSTKSGASSPTFKVQSNKWGAPAYEWAISDYMMLSEQLGRFENDRFPEK